MTSAGSPARKTAWLFLVGFACACLLFWWLPSILFRVLGLDDPVHGWALCVSLLALAFFAAGYALPPLRFKTPFTQQLIDTCETIAYQATLWIAFPALFLALQFFLSRFRVSYGEGENIPFLYQAVFYCHMFFAFLFLGAARTIPQDRRRIILVSVFVIAPRLIVSLCWGRFFLVQAVAPILFIGLARGWITLSAKRFLQLSALAIFIIFVPALTRGDNFLGQDELIAFFQGGSSLSLFQDNRDLNLKGRCPPLAVSMTAKLIPYDLLGICTMEYKGRKSMPATLDRILTENEPSTQYTLTGTGANYLLELYLTGGTGAVFLGSALFGFTNRCCIQWISERSLFAGIWAESLSRALFAPRGTLGYVYERVPSLLLATLITIGLAWALHTVGQGSRRSDEKSPTRSPSLLADGES